LDKFTNRSELATLILNNIKKFENLNNGNILNEENLYSLNKVLNELGYSIISGANLTLVKIPNGYTQDFEGLPEFDYNVVKDSTGKYFTLNADGSVSEITEEFFKIFSEDVMSEIKEDSKDIDSLTNPEDILLAKIWKQVQSKSGGEGSAQTIDDILNMIDDESL
jgi:hypothetical protein